MKFLHVADVRLGVVPDRDKPWQQERAKEIYDEFFRLITYAKEHTTDLILISGNLFDYVSGVEELTMIDEKLMTLEDTLIIYQPGDKDMLTPGSALATFAWKSNTYVLSGTGAKLSFPDFNGKPLDIYGCAVGTDKAQLSAACHVHTEKAHFNILMAPQADAGMRNRIYDYVASAKGHSYQMMVRNQIYAPGVFVPVSAAESGRHGFIEGILPEDADDRKQIRFVNFATRQYKTINYPVNKYMTSMEIAEDLMHLMKKEGSDNLYTVNLIRDAACEKSFDIEKYFEFEKLYILEINGGHYDRESYERYVWANKNTAFGGLLNKLYTTDPQKRDGVKLAVEQIIEKSGVNDRKSDRIYDKTYAETKKQALNTLQSMKNELLASPEIKEYQDVKKQLEESRDADIQLTSLVAAEQKQEMQLAIEKSNASLIPRRYKRKWKRNGIRIAIIPFIILIFLCISWLPPVVRAWLGRYPSAAMMLGLFAAICLIIVFFYWMGYHMSQLRDTRYADRGFQGEMNEARERIADADIALSDIRKERKKYQLIKNRNKVLEASLNQDDVAGKKIYYEIEIIEEAITALKEN